MDISGVLNNILAVGTSLCIPAFLVQGTADFELVSCQGESSENLLTGDDVSESSSSDLNELESSDSSCIEQDDSEDEVCDDLEAKEVEDADSAKKTKTIRRTRYSREEYSCTLCPYKCTTEKAFLRHLRGCESKETSKAATVNNSSVEMLKLSCSICGKDRSGKESLEKHMLKHKEGKHFCCDMCKFKSMQLKKLIQHRRMHTGERPHLCPFCTYRSARRDNLRSHVRRVHKKTNLTKDTFTPRNMLLTPRQNR